ncbi:hypothetical protein [Solirubrobacter soli]|uniref:hypothetical protein n=1 Tax=Solirubrobacter soli TaxID=363832 RepID=UPI00042A406B|nr:hypothetical protein [Solirubrobacter soli]
MALNDLIIDARAIRHLDLAQRKPVLLNFIGGLPAAEQRPVLLDLLERKEIPPTLTAPEVQTLAAAAGVSAAVVQEGVEAAADGALTPLLQIRAPSGMDPIALNAVKETRIEFDAKLAAYPGIRLSKRGITGTVEKVTGRLDSLDLEDARRLALAQPAIYEWLFLQALDEGQVEKSDDAGIVDWILTHLDDEALLKFLRRAIDAVLAAQLIVLEPAERDDLARLALTRGIDLRIGKLTAAVLALVDVRRRQGSVPRLVDVYLAKNEIKPEAADERIRQGMIDYLVELELSMTYERVVAGEFDEYFALAYDAARRQRADSDDPIDIARSGRRKGVQSDFTIRRISQLDKTTVVRPKAIYAAGALFTIFVEGELMRMFDIADALSLEWHRGGLDVSEGDVASLLNRIEHLRNDRPDDSERGMLYRRLFNYGEAEMLSGALVNERFGEHFDRLMYEVTRLVDLQDRAFNDPRQISRAGVVSALTSVQHNLSQFVTGSAFLKIEELISYLNECQELITSEPIVSRYGGTEQSVTSAIKNMGMTFLDASLPVEDLVELAERGNDVFNFIGGFTRGNLREEPFQDFLDAAQQTIIARAAVDDTAWQPSDHDRDRWRRRRRRHRDDDAPDSGVNGKVPAGAIDEWDR